MGIAVVILPVVLIIGFLIWVLLQPRDETTMGRENRIRREAEREAKRRKRDGGGNDVDRS